MSKGNIKKTVVAIGGGSIGGISKRTGKRKPIEAIGLYKKLFELSNVENPKILLVCTASLDNSSDYKALKKFFKEIGPCEVSSLKLSLKDITQKEIAKATLNQDIIFVGGGHGELMLNRWEETGFFDILKEAYNAGIVISGKSAGGICWFDHVDTVDQQHYVQKSEYQPKLLKGLGFIPGIAVPHFEQVPQSEIEETIELFKGKTGTFYGIDNCSAIISVDGKIEYISCKEHSKVHEVYSN